MGWEDKYQVTPGGCHEWLRARQSRGYGVVWFEGKLHLAHRVAWRRAYGEWPRQGLVVDHICNNKGCINVAHLQEVPNHINLRRAHPPKEDPKAERKRAMNRRAQAKMRGSYASTYSPERE